MKLRTKAMLRWYWRKLCNMVGMCPCGTQVNWTFTGRGICPRCGR